jgi:tRNA(His) guanylyltransferase
MSVSDSMGDRMKMYEAPSTSRKAFKGQPIIARLDGSNFHAFTKGLKRPYDERLSKLMTSTMMSLVDRFGASVGYTQSDEITLAWFIDSSSQSQYPFDGRFQKLESLLAAYATMKFNQVLQTYLPEKGAEEPIFDARAFAVPNLLEAYHEILWRQQDCTKNAISMAAQSMFSHKSLQGQNGSVMQERMWSECGVNFNDYPPFFRRGTFARRVKVMKPLDKEAIAKMETAGKIPKNLDNLLFVTERSEIQTSNAWLSKLEDPISYLFKSGAETYKAVPGTELDGLVKVIV